MRQRNESIQFAENLYKIKNPRFRAMGMLLLHLLRRKYTCMSFDPVLGCNMKCRMCYFSDEAKRREMHGVFSDRDVAAIARSIFHMF